MADGKEVVVTDEDYAALFPPADAEAAPVPPVSGDAIIGAIATADRAKADPTDFARIAWRDDVPASNAKLARIAKAIGTTPEKLRAAASA